MRTLRPMPMLAIGTAISLLAACSSSHPTTAPTTTSTTLVADTSAVPVATTTATTAPQPTAAPTTVAPTAAPTTTTAAPTTTATTLPPTTTTAPAGARLSLLPDGIGDARFGAVPDDVTAFISGILGTPTKDTGWVDAASRTCRGSQVRFVSWGDLTLSFGDESDIATERQHFYSWTFGPPSGTSISPAGLMTPERIGIGSTVAQLRAAYPASQFIEGDDVNTPRAILPSGVVAYLTDTSDAGAITVMNGGQPGCGE